MLHKFQSLYSEKDKTLKIFVKGVPRGSHAGYIRVNLTHFDGRERRLVNTMNASMERAIRVGRLVPEDVAGLSAAQPKLRNALKNAIDKALRRGRNWVARHQLFYENADLTAEEVWALVIQSERNKERKLQRALAELKMDEAKIERRELIADDVKIFVWQRDGGKCVKCGSTKNLEFDHVIAVVKGGSNTARNVQILCEECNRKKGPNLI